MDNFIRNRITQLKINKNISEYQMSLDLGYSNKVDAPSSEINGLSEDDMQLLLLIIKRLKS